MEGALKIKWHPEKGITKSETRQVLSEAPGSETQRVLHILRNPYGYSATEIRQMQIKACNLIERYHDAYLNMRKFAEDNGLDTTTHG